MHKRKRMHKTILQTRKIGALAVLVVAALMSSCGDGSGGVGYPGTEPSALPSTNDSGGSGAFGGSASNGGTTGSQTPAGSGTDVAGGTGSGGTGIDPGGVGSGGTGVMAGLSIGSIDGFGSVIVNGIRFNIDNITPQIEDVSALALGMTVQIRGPYDDATMEGTATSLISAAELRGKITAIDAVASRIWVNGYPADVDDATVIVGVPGFANLAVNDEVQIHGLPSSSTLSATRIEKLTIAGLPIMTGAVTGLDTAQTSFMLGSVTVSYGGASLSGFGPTPLANGTIVRVRASGVPSKGVLPAALVQRWISVPDAGTSGLAITGMVENFTSVSDTFTVAGVTVDARATSIKADVLKALSNGSIINVSGVYSAGILTATKLKLVKANGSPAMPLFSLSGAVQAYVSAADFKVQGQRVDAGAAVFTGGTALQLGQNPAPKVKVVGIKLINGVLIADTVAF
jgi:Domain of unknown function (DUF5666)